MPGIISAGLGYGHLWISTPRPKCPQVVREMQSLLLEQGFKGEGVGEEVPRVCSKPARLEDC